jgi:hypothetical protein
MGLFIPAYTGRRVWYGHPFETTDAQRMENLVLKFFSGADLASDEKAILVADYLFYGNRERRLGEINLNAGYELVFEVGDLRVYRIE